MAKNLNVANAGIETSKSRQVRVDYGYCPVDTANAIIDLLCELTKLPWGHVIARKRVIAIMSADCDVAFIAPGVKISTKKRTYTLHAMRKFTRTAIVDAQIRLIFAQHTTIQLHQTRTQDDPVADMIISGAISNTPGIYDTNIFMPKFIPCDYYAGMYPVAQWMQEDSVGGFRRVKMEDLI